MARFQSILWEDGTRCPAAETPDYFRDLNLDQIIEALTAGREEYDLKPFFCTPLTRVENVEYRHEVWRDLEQAPLLECVKAFASAIRLMRKELGLAGKLYYKQSKDRWFLQAAETYCQAVSRFGTELGGQEIASRALVGLRDYIRAYTDSAGFAELQSAVAQLTEDLAKVRYAILIQGSGFKVRAYEGEQDYTEEVTRTFEKFRQGAAKDYQGKFENAVEMDHIEAKILDFVALLNPELFRTMEAFRAQHEDFIDLVLARFDREIQFYLCYLDHMASFQRKSLEFCYPSVSSEDKAVRSEAGFDLALAAKLRATETPVVCNDFYLEDDQRIFLVSGPNQGGKTTFARVFGQLHHLGSLGCPVPGRAATLFLPDRIFTHFEREENIANLRGKLQDDLVRIREILEEATPRSIVLLNEIFTSTTLEDAIFLARKVIDQLVQKDLLCVCVTFLDELVAASETIVSMVSTVQPADTAIRTYRVIRRPPDGRSYAISVAERHGLTYERLLERIPASPAGDDTSTQERSEAGLEGCRCS